jgi:hypothetical protein
MMEMMVNLIQGWGVTSLKGKSLAPEKGTKNALCATTIKSAKNNKEKESCSVRFL